MKLKVAVVGIGNMGRYHINNYSEMNNVELVAICDKDKSKLSKYSDSIEKYDNIDDLICNKDIDLISLVTPTSTHYSLGKKIIKNQINLLVEKPISDNLDNAKELIKLAKINNVILAVGHIERYNPAVLKLKELIEKGVLGNITSISTKRVGNMPSQINDVNVISDLGVHDLDLVRYLASSEVKDISANAGNGKLSDRFDYADIFIKFENDISAHVQVNWLTPVKIRTITITGTKAYLEVDLIKQQIKLYESFKFEQALTYDEILKDYNLNKGTSVNLIKKQPLRSELDNVVNSILGKKSNIITEDAVETLKIVKQIEDILKK